MNKILILAIATLALMIALTTPGIPGAPGTNGSGLHKHKTITNDYTINSTTDETIFIDSTQNNIFITLPTAINDTNVYVIKRIDVNSSNTVTINTTNLLQSILFDLGLSSNFYTGNTTTTYNSESGYNIASRITVGATGSMNAVGVGINVSVSGGTKMKMALYSGSATVPSTLLRSSNEQILTTGWNNFPFSIPYALTPGSYYWVAYQANNNSATLYRVPNTGTRCYNALIYGSFPSTFSSCSADGYSSFEEIMISSSYSLIQIDSNALHLQSNNYNWWVI
jgi:hypothetical protein